MPQSGSVLSSLSSTLVSPLAATPGIGAGLAPSSPKTLITSFTGACPASIQSPRELHRTVLLRIWSCLSRSAASPVNCVLISYLSLNFWISHSASSLEALTVTSSPWTKSADSPRLFGVHTRTCSLVPCASLSPPRSVQARTPSFEQRHGCRANSFSAAHTADCLVLLRLLPEARCRLCASPSHRSTLFARQSPRALSLFSGCLTLPPR